MIYIGQAKKHLFLAMAGMLGWQSAQAAIKPIDAAQCRYMEEHNTIAPNNPVPCSRLHEVSFNINLLAGNEDSVGRVVVLDVVAPRIQGIFDTLYANGFRLHTAIPVEAFDGDDDESMRLNNTSAFNGRVIAGATNWSLHAYGAAVDLNPVQNPFIDNNADGTATIKPVEAARSGINRLDARPGKPPRAGLAEDVIDTFAENGFLSWGGYWNYPVDYQHFEVGPRAFIQRLATLPLPEATVAFDTYIESYRRCVADAPATTPHAVRRATCADRVMNQTASK
jgi:hypothetical protein